MAVKHLKIFHSRVEDENVCVAFKSLLREFETFRLLLGNPNIVEFYGLCIHEGIGLLCMELMDLSLRELYILIHKTGKKFPKKLLGAVFVRTLNALNACSDKGIIHRDIKPNNILVNYR